MKKRAIIASLLCLCTLVVLAQKNSFTDKLRLGGNVGMTFGSYTSILVSPQIGYAVTDWLTVGVSPEYIYTNYDYYNQSVFGMGVFSRAEYAKLFATASYQYDVVTTNSSTVVGNNSAKSYVSSLWLGGGYRQSIGNRMWLYVGGSYNVLYDKKTSVYGSAFIPTVSISVGI